METGVPKLFKGIFEPVTNLRSEADVNVGKILTELVFPPNPD